jgi:transcription termination/antitermination protein NusG
MAKQQINLGRNWYVIRTYSGYEDAVTKSLEQRITALDMQDKIFKVLVPKVKKIKLKNGKREVIEEKLYPGYILVDMIVTDESWYVVRNTPKVTGFIGTETTPIPVSPEEMGIITKNIGELEPRYKISYLPGDIVKITEGPFKDFEGKVTGVDEEKGRVKVIVTLFNRETPLDLDFLEVKKN